MSESSSRPEDLSDAQRDFFLDMGMNSGYSVGGNDAGELIVSCRDHDGRDTISMAPVFACAARYGLTVVDGEARWDDETVELVVVDGDWQTGEDGDSDG